MWQAEAPVQPGSNPPGIYLTANQGAAGVRAAVHKLGVCTVVFFDSERVSPTLDAGNYMSEFRNKVMNFVLDPDGNFRSDTRVRILLRPRHGKLVPLDSEGLAQYDYRYIPNHEEKDEYKGEDKFVMEVSAAGEAVRIYYTMRLQVGEPRSYIGDDHERHEHGAGYCPKGESWKISIASPQALDLATVQRGAALSALLAGIRPAQPVMRKPGPWQILPTKSSKNALSLA